MKRARQEQPVGKFVVADPKICHGSLTFRGTRILVADVLEQVACGMDWDSIIEEWNGGICKEAIREAVQFASQALLRHPEEITAERISA